MLTPAEELGLSGMNLAGRVRKAFYALSAPELLELAARMKEQCIRRHLVYLRDGQPDPVRVLPCPLTMLPDQIGYIHFVSLTLQNALKRLPDLYRSDERVQRMLQLSPEEERWLNDCWGPQHQDSNPIFGRLDAVVDFCSPMWKESLKFVEPNLSGIGGLHMTPMAEQIVAEVVFPVLSAHRPELALDIGQDIRELFLQEVLDHLEAIGRPRGTICFVEPKYCNTGIDEQQVLAEFYHAHHGIRVLHADPTELSIRNGEVYFGPDRVDVVYRDYTVSDLLELGRSGANIEPMRQLFRENRVISSIAAELDQKNCWEVLTDPEIVRQYYSAEERQVFRRHVLWTRRLSDRSTALPGGEQGDLLDYVRREQESLVMKPNRAYGGTGVLLGLAASASEWEEAIERAMSDGQDWVVQQLAGIPVHEFPVVDESGHVQLEPFYVVMGFAPSKYGVAILCRASQKQVVNVAQRGGICAIAIGHPTQQLVGPDRLG